MSEDRGQISGWQLAGPQGEYVIPKRREKGYVFLLIPELTDAFYQRTLIPTGITRNFTTIQGGSGVQNTIEPYSQVTTAGKHTPILPHIGRILAKTAKGPLNFALDVSRATWLQSEDALGNVAAKLRAHFTDCKITVKWSNLTNEQIAVHQLDALLSFAQIPDDRESDMA